MLFQIVEGHLNSLDYFITLTAPDKYETKIQITKEPEKDNYIGFLDATNKETKEEYNVCAAVLFSYGPRVRFEIKEKIETLPKDLQEALKMLKETADTFRTFLKMADTFTFN